MITLSENAEKSLHDYLRQARAYLRRSKSVDADEIEQNITEHIENELEGAGVARCARRRIKKAR